MTKATPSRSEQAAKRISRANRARQCSQKHPCGFWYAVNELGQPIERLSTMATDEFSASEHPLVTISLSDRQLDEEGLHAFTEAFYRLFGERAARADVGRYLPMLPAGIKLLADRDPWYMAILQERYLLHRGVRRLVTRYRVHNETIDRLTHDALNTLRDYVLEVERSSIAC